MKYILAATTLLTIMACNNSGDTAEVSDTREVKDTTGTVYALDSTSTLQWKGSKPTGSHTGTFNLTGELVVNENNVAGGNFTIDIASLVNHDLTENDGKSKLEGHLKSPDFFDVAKFPSAKFVITSVTPATSDSAGTHVVSGNLTLKDSTKNVTFPATITVDDRTISAKADFNIDRTLWGMNYKGPNNPQDWFIRKDVNIALNLTAKKK